jgi:hypothetical protein
MGDTSEVEKKPVEPETPSFGARVWAGFKATMGWIGAKGLGPILAGVVIIVAVVLVSMGFKDLQIGGLLGKLLGKKDPKGEGSTVDLANTVDPDRVGPDGKLIQPGDPDSKGMTQAVVVPIKEPGLFSDPKKVVFTEPGKDKPTEIILPDGVTNKDVDQVVVVRPDVMVVTVKDKSGIPAKTVDDLLLKYGK